ncbi:MAG: bifunctional [glutamine synthetase] adenylyltransferase/[glutamine synthetase]-adenylyl-L-tyrosine phosphorylase [Actinobacteria bacterium]|nr:bifunctional [glutamine synthetase] adenylyltransferase/[glutamine synthetase]-adenylyl-L-tyrosine phosphorylase [Actinomycetota bacterium]
MTRDIGIGTKLIQSGVFDIAQAQSRIETANLNQNQLDLILDLAAKSANPDDLITALLKNKAWLDLPQPTLIKLSAVLGVSEKIYDWLDKRPGMIPALNQELSTNRIELISSFLNTVSDLSGDQARAALKQRYQQQVITIASCDLTGEASFAQVSQELSWLADAVLSSALCIAERELPEAAKQVSIAVIALGKTGGIELNYISDVDVVFVASPKSDVEESVALTAGTKLASLMMRICSEPTIDGVIWPVDAALRPEGKAGALVRTISSYLSYYDRWAETWEFQALLKARYSTGDEQLAQEFIQQTQELVWVAVSKPNFVTNARRMRARVEENISEREQGRQIKLGRGGLRDIEFTVQLLQLVHARTDETLRTGNTLLGLAALAQGGYVGRSDAELLRNHYIWLRTLEHRLQLRQMTRTQVLPETEFELRILGRAMEFKVDPANELLSNWKDLANQVRNLHEKLFYRPLLDAVAILPSEAIRLSESEAETRLTALGYLDAKSALRHIEALTKGAKRRAAIQRTLLPVLLNWWSAGPSPDRSLLAFRRLSEALGDTPWFLSSLRDDAQVAERVARVTGASEFLVDLLLRAPESLAMLSNDLELTPKREAELIFECQTIASRYLSDSERAVGALRSLRRRELVRIAAASVLNLISVDEVGKAITDLNRSVLDAALKVVEHQVALTLPNGVATDFAIIAMGRFGGAELGFGSDLDVLFVHRPHPGSDETQTTPVATKIASELRSLLMAPHPDPAIELDADLRPEGKKGPLVRTLDSYQAYYQRWSITWESQALLRAEFAAGNRDVADEFLQIVNPLRWPSSGIDSDQLRDVRLLKARMEAERLPKGADPALHLKLGKGGLSDVEWVAQLIQMRYSAKHSELQTTSTIETLLAAAELNLVSDSDAQILISAWRFSSQIRNGFILSLGKSSDSITTDQNQLRALSYLLNYPVDNSNQLVDDYLRTARRAREVFERLFYDS